MSSCCSLERFDVAHDRGAVKVARLLARLPAVLIISADGQHLRRLPRPQVHGPSATPATPAPPSRSRCCRRAIAHAIPLLNKSTHLQMPGRRPPGAVDDGCDHRPGSDWRSMRRFFRTGGRIEATNDDPGAVIAAAVIATAISEPVDSSLVRVAGKSRNRTISPAPPPAACSQPTMAIASSPTPERLWCLLLRSQSQHAEDRTLRVGQHSAPPNRRNKECRTARRLMPDAVSRSEHCVGRALDLIDGRRASQPQPLTACSDGRTDICPPAVGIFRNPNRNRSPNARTRTSRTRTVTS